MLGITDHQGDADQTPAGRQHSHWEDHDRERGTESAGTESAGTESTGTECAGDDTRRRGRSAAGGNAEPSSRCGNTVRSSESDAG